MLNQNLFIYPYFPTILKVDICVLKMKIQVVDSLKVISEITKLEAFDGNNFKCWKERILPILEFTKIDWVLYKPKP